MVASAELNGLALSLGETISKQEFSSGSGDALRVEVKLQRKHDKSPVAAHQAFLRFTHKEEKVDTYFVLTADSKKTHSAFLQFSTLSKKFGYKSGSHKLQLILGDPTFEVRPFAAFSCLVLLTSTLGGLNGSAFERMYPQELTVLSWFMAAIDRVGPW